MDEKDLKRLSATLGKDSERKFYVYMLLDGCHNPFYIGKGQGVRVFQHEWDALNFQRELDELSKGNPSEEVVFSKQVSDKIERICRELQQGQTVGKVILKWGLTEEEAFMCESALINMHNCLHADDGLALTNIVNGHASGPEKDDTRARTVEEFVNTVAIESEFFPREIGRGERIAFIKINDALAALGHSPSDEEVYEAVRACWKFSQRNYTRYCASGKSDFCGLPKYVVALDRQIVVGVYKVKSWHRLFDDDYDFPTLPKEGRKEDKRIIESLTDGMKDSIRTGLLSDKVIKRDILEGECPEFVESFRRYKRSGGLKNEKQYCSIMVRLGFVREETGTDGVLNELRAHFARPVLLLDRYLRGQKEFMFNEYDRWDVAELRR